MFTGVGTFWQRVGHRLFAIHSPSGLELDGCLVCGMPSREKILADIDEAYRKGLESGLGRMNAYVDSAYRKGLEDGVKDDTIDNDFLPLWDPKTIRGRIYYKSETPGEREM